MLKDASFISAIWRLLGTKRQDRRSDDVTQLALRNAVNVGAGHTLERVLDARQVAPADKRIPLAQTTLRGVTCTFEQVATLGEFTRCLR